MLYCGACTALVISLLWLIYPGWAASVAPRSWLWPEASARRTAPWVRHRYGMRALVYASGDRDSIDACEQTAAKAKEPVGCTIRIGTASRGN